MKKIVPICAAVAAAAMMLSISTPAMAMGGPSGPHVTYPVQGNIGEVIVNPYKVAPLTAVIRDAGYDLSDVTVRIVPKTNGQEITYKVSRTELKTHAGIPVFGLYPDWQNTVEVSYTRTFQGKSEKFKDTYRFYVPSVYTVSTGMPNQVTLKSSKAPTNYFTPNILRKSWSRLVVSVVHLDALAFPVAAT